MQNQLENPKRTWQEPEITGITILNGTASSHHELLQNSPGS